MRFQGSQLLLTGILLASWVPGRAQEVAHTATPTVIRSETRLVLVDAVVTDKKGNYVADLAQKNFKVFEDNKEQPITSFSFEADPASPNNNQKHYLVLFFDNASVSAGDQMQARSAAQKFVDNNTGPNKFIAVVNFSGTLRITQNFTNDADRLREVISGVKNSSVSTTDDTTPSLSGASLSSAASFGITSVLLGLRSLAKGLSDVPGRKMVVMLTAGFPSDDPTVHSELIATVDACNKSNVSVYPIDVRGLVAPTPGMNPRPGGRGGRLPMAQLFSPLGLGTGLSTLNLASFENSFQTRGGTSTGSPGAGAGGSTGGATGGAAGGARGGAGTAPGAPSAGPGAGVGAGGRGTAPGAPGTGVGARGPTNAPGSTAGRGGAAPPLNPTVMNRNPANMNAMRSIVPPFMGGIDNNQNALYMLAEGTGGFVIVNTNDLLGGMEKIAREQNQFYLIGFSPSESPEGTCHTLHVKVDRGGDSVRSRSGYCNVRQKDLLAGKPAETELESIAAGQAKGNLGSPLQLPFFYTAPNVARVNLAMEIPSSAFKFAKEKGKLHAEMNLMGVAYRKDDTVGAKFSDTLKFDFDNNTQVDLFHKTPVHYESQFDIASGEYNMKVVFSAGGENFGKIEKPLTVDPFDGKQFVISGLALTKELHDQKQEDLGLEAVLIEDKVPLVARGIQAVPAAEYRFLQSDPAAVYMEIVDPALTAEKPPRVGFALRITDEKTGEKKVDTGNQPLGNEYIRPGNSTVSVLLKLPVRDLTPGSYRLDVTGLDETGRSMTRTTQFQVEAAKAQGLGWDKN